MSLVPEMWVLVGFMVGLDRWGTGKKSRPRPNARQHSSADLPSPIVPNKYNVCPLGGWGIGPSSGSPWAVWVGVVESGFQNLESIRLLSIGSSTESLHFNNNIRSMYLSVLLLYRASNSEK
ncbi:hypothetical protein XENTR_v10017962 [Xenopus tropicalis]|nr:hypothetical protein XENTR_v10017962 [Xenopus tropicalis]